MSYRGQLSCQMIVLVPNLYFQNQNNNARRPDRLEFKEQVLVRRKDDEKEGRNPVNRGDQFILVSGQSNWTGSDWSIGNIATR